MEEDNENEDDTSDDILEDRTRELKDLKKVREQLGDIYRTVVAAFDDKNDQSAKAEECWDIYDCVLNDNQAYNGTSQVYLPIVQDSVDARVTRFTNMLFPRNGQYVDIASTDGTIPYEIISLLNDRVRKAKIRTDVVPPMVKAGDCTGQYSLYLEWYKNTRHTVKKVQKAETMAEGHEVAGSRKYDDREFEEVKDEYPRARVLDPRHLAVIPSNVDDIEDAEIVCVKLPMTQGKVKKLIAEGVFDDEEGELLLSNFKGNDTQASGGTDPDKQAQNAAGVQSNGKGGKVAIIFQVWCELKIGKARRRCVTYFAGETQVLSCKRNPYWNDRVPVISKPVKKKPGSFWGTAPVADVAKIAYAANDAVNMGLDSAQYALLPIVMTDPEKNPRVGSMVMTMAAIWETSPNDTQFTEFPPLWKDALTLVAEAKQQIQQSLGVNAAMIPHGAGKKKPSQAEVSQEQQVILESTSDEVTTIEAGIMNELLRWFYELDYQFRDEATTVKKYGPLGTYAGMEEIPPLQSGNRYEFSWWGTEATKTAQQIQQMIAGMNILRGIPEQMLNGRKLDFGPLADYLVEVTYGPRLAPKTLIDQRHQLSVSVEQENDLLLAGFPVMTHPNDPDAEHMMGHMPLTQAADPDVINKAKLHIMAHMEQMQKRAQDAQGTPGQPGAQGQPRMGAQPGQVRNGQNPPGAIHPDAMQDARKMPQ